MSPWMQLVSLRCMRMVTWAVPQATHPDGTVYRARFYEQSKQFLCLGPGYKVSLEASP